MFHNGDITRNEYMLTGKFRKKGYDWWWHNFTAVDRETKEEVPFFIEFFLCNPALGGKNPVYGQLSEQARPSYLMVKAGCWGKHKKQLHRFFSWEDVRIHGKAPYSVSAKDCFASETLLKGSVYVSEEDASHTEYMSDSGYMEWNLSVTKEVAFHVGYGANRLFRALKAFEMYWHAEGMKSTYSGTVTIDGRTYDVIKNCSYGYADKNWGSNFTSPWVWLSSNCMTSRLTGQKLTNSVFDIGGGCPKVFGIALDRKLLGGIYYEGMEFEYNFSKFWMLPRTKFSFKEDETYVYWKVWQENASSVMKLSAKCKKEDMLLVNYEAPDGKKRHNRLWNGGNGVGRLKIYKKNKGQLLLIDDIDITHIGCEYGEYNCH